MAQLLLSQSYLTDRSIIDNNVDFKKLTPIIELVQDIYIQPLLGTNLFNQIITQSTPPTTLTAANLFLLDNHILKIMVLYVLAEAPKSLKYRYMNKGVLVKSPEGSNPIDLNELKFLNDDWISKAQLYAKRMELYIKANISLYPEYSTNNELDEEQPRSASQIDIYLPDNKCDE